MRYRFLTLFIALLATMLIYPVLHGPGGSVFVANVLITALCAAGARAIFGESRRGTLKMLIAAPPALGAWLGYFAPETATTTIVVVHAGTMLFHLYMLCIVLRSVYREPKISADGVFAAMCGYVLLGVAFGHAYGILETLQPGSFHSDVIALNRNDEHIVLTYFSFITLATVGYGDVLPVVPLARSLAMVEAIIGQFYIAVLVADLIGKRISQSMEAAPPPRP